MRFAWGKGSRSEVLPYETETNRHCSTTDQQARGSVWWQPVGIY